MGTEGQNIVKADKEKLVDFLRMAFADEWTAYYQYWLGAKVARGMMRNAVVSELEEHAEDEEKHAGMIADRLIELGAGPIMSPSGWDEKGDCPFILPDDQNIIELLKQNIKGEQCAIKAYNSILPDLKDSDPVTYKMIVEILTDEVHHEEDLEALIEDMKMAKNMKMSNIVENIVNSNKFSKEMEVDLENEKEFIKWVKEQDKVKCPIDNKVTMTPEFLYDKIYRLLVGPTSGGNAKRLARYAVYNVIKNDIFNK